MKQSHSMDWKYLESVFNLLPIVSAHSSYWNYISNTSFPVQFMLTTGLFVGFKSIFSISEKPSIVVNHSWRCDRWVYLSEGEDAGAGGHSQLLLQVLGVGPGLLQRQPGHEAVHWWVAHPQGLLHALLKGPAHRHHLNPKEGDPAQRINWACEEGE